LKDSKINTENLSETLKKISQKIENKKEKFFELKTKENKKQSVTFWKKQLEEMRKGLSV